MAWVEVTGITLMFVWRLLQRVGPMQDFRPSNKCPVLSVLKYHSELNLKLIHSKLLTYHSMFAFPFISLTCRFRHKALNYQINSSCCYCLTYSVSQVTFNSSCFMSFLGLVSEHYNAVVWGYSARKATYKQKNYTVCRKLRIVDDFLSDGII